MKLKLTGFDRWWKSEFAPHAQGKLTGADAWQAATERALRAVEKTINAASRCSGCDCDVESIRRLIEEDENL